MELLHRLPCPMLDYWPLEMFVWVMWQYGDVGHWTAVHATAFVLFPQLKNVPYFDTWEQCIVIWILYFPVSVESALSSPSIPFSLLFCGVAAGSVGPVHGEEPVWHDVLHAHRAAEAPPTRGWDPQSVPGACYLQGCCRTGHGEQGFVREGDG